MGIIISALAGFIKVPFVGNFANRLVNRYTAHGIIIVVMQLEQMGVLPVGISKSIDGLGTADIAMWLTLAIGIYFVFHMPKFKTRLDKLNYEVALTKAQTELFNAKKELEECINCNKGSVTNASK